MKMKVFRSTLVLCCILSYAQTHATTPTGQMEKALALRLAKARSSCLVGGKKIYAYDPSWLKTFYKRRTYHPAWSVDGRLRKEEVHQLAAYLSKTDLDGLDPSDYFACAVESIAGWYDQAAPMDDTAASRVDLLLTDAFLRIASDLSCGRIDPRSVNEEWNIRPQKIDVAGVLQRALDSAGIGPSLDRLRPHGREYEYLMKALAFYRSLPDAPDPEKIAGTRRLAKGDSNSRVVTLRKRLAIWSPGIDVENAVFDQPLAEVLKVFQDDHGIDPDGVAGMETIAALNRTPADDVQQIIVNLERCRWLPPEPEGRHITVNIPSFELRVMEGGLTVKDMRVVVGRSDHRTPLLCNAMTHIVFSPYWNVPPAIAANEIIPQIIKNVSYLKKESIRVFEKDGNDLSEVDPEAIDWTAVQDRDLRFRMDPGARNSLGRIKFMFPNDNNVYLHDTPAKNLFKKNVRPFSHGCVRVEEPVALAAYLLAKDTAWVKQEIRTASSHHGERAVSLAEPVPVRLQYCTLWVDDTGVLQFRKDLYGWDDQVAKSLRGVPVIHRAPPVRHFALHAGPSLQSVSVE